MKKFAIIILSLIVALLSDAQTYRQEQQSETSDKKSKTVAVAPSYAWKILPPLGLQEEATIDTLLVNYCQESVPSAVSPAYATTGNLGSEGQTMIFFERKPISDFFFQDALEAWRPTLENQVFYNTRIPMTLVTYNTGGGKLAAQDRLKTTFSGNINKKAQVGAMLDYLYSKGSYDFQAAKDLMWGVSGSYMGDRYEMQAFLNHWNMLNKENGGITDDLYITDPAELQGGQTSINPKSIPTNLTAAHSRLVGGQIYINNRYKVGYWDEEHGTDSLGNDTILNRTYIPVSSFIWTLDYKQSRHTFKNEDVAEDAEFWKNRYLSLDGTHDLTEYWSLSNTIGISMLEGFHKFAKFGLAAYLTHQVRKYTQTPDTIDYGMELPEGLSQYPLDTRLPSKTSENLLWVGGQLTKQKGSILTYEATAQFGVVGPVVGDVDVEGNVSTRFKLFGDTVTIIGYGHFSNQEAPYLMNNYVSNHFIWKNDFGKERRVRFGGKLIIPHTNTRVNVGVENLQNYIYFNSDCMPTQHSGSVQVLNASLEQDFRVGVLNWNNRLTYQTSSEESVIPLPKLSVYSNLFLLFKVAKVLDVQLGIDCDYYTEYKAVGYQPATMTFYNQNEIVCGNYPFMNAYANLKLGKTRFYILFSHVNQGLFGQSNYFSMPHYPLNPRRFQIGISVDFAN